MHDKCIENDKKTGVSDLKPGLKTKLVPVI